MAGSSQTESKNISRISIIIATLNVEKTLQNCLDSIYGQQYPSIEIVLMDGGSTDATIDILKTNNHKVTRFKPWSVNGTAPPGFYRSVHL